MTWYISRGEDLRREQKICFRFFRRLPYTYKDSDLVFTECLYSDNSAKANKYPKRGYVKQNCALTTDLRFVDRSKFRKVFGRDGKKYVDVHYTLVVSVKCALMRFSSEFDGKEFGSVEAKYDSL